MNYQIEWFSPSLGTPIVSIAEYGIVFNKAAIMALENPHAIKVGFDKNLKCIFVLGVAEEECTEDAMLFREKERGGFIRINNKDFVRFIMRYCTDIKLDKAKRFLSRKENQYLIVDLNSPAELHEDKVDKEMEG